MDYFNTSEKDKITKKLDEYLQNNPSDAPHFLNVISEALEKYGESVKKQRNGMAQNAILYIMGFVLDSKKLKKLGADNSVTSMIDAMFYCFPNGSPEYHAPIMKEGFKYFQECCLKINILDNENWCDWLRKVKGNEYYEWMGKVLDYKFDEK